MTIFSQSLFPFVSSHFVAFSLFSAGHIKFTLISYTYRISRWIEPPEYHLLSKFEIP